MERNWKELFRVEEISRDKELKTEIHEAHDHPACKRARGFVCKCGCHGAYHGSYWAEKNQRLDQVLSDKEPQPILNRDSAVPYFEVC